MKITPYNILRHELVGSHTKVVESSCPQYKGIEGAVIGETKNTLVIRTAKGDKTLPKKDNVFEISVDSLRVLVDGPLIIGRPEDRIKNKVRITF